MLNITNITTTTSSPTSSNQDVIPKIVVVGVGGAGGNGVNNMKESGLEGCDFIVCNSDAQALANSLAETTLQLGPHVTGGLGAGSKPDVGRAAAEESLDEVMQHLEGANMAFITAGMGGGTGTGAAPVIAKACRDMGILTVGVVTKPFHFEGTHRMKMAEEGIDQMQEYVDTLIVIPNQNLFRVANENTTFSEAFVMADSVLQSGVRGVTDLMVRPGLVNLDFADIRTAMMEMGKAMMGTGEAAGEKRAIEAAESAINNPLLDDVSMKGAHGLIINVTGGYDMTLFEADEACNRIRDEVDPEANIIFGATFDETLEGKMRVSIVATGIEKEAVQKSKPVGGSGRLMRANPQTTSAAAPAAKPSTPPAQAVSQTLSAAPSSLGINMSSAPAEAPSLSAPLQAPTAATMEAPETDLFEQQQFTNFPPSNVPVHVPQNTALRGTRYKNSFIPPKPVDSGYSAGPQGFHNTQAQTQEAPQAEPQQHVQSTGLKLNPPKLPNPENPRKTPSLLERISGTVQQSIEGLTSGGKREQADLAPQTRGEYSTPPMSQDSMYSQAPSQGQLNIDAPSGEKRSESDLDIPAFLRRQAN